MGSQPPTSSPLVEVSDDAAIHDVVHGNREMFEVLVRRYNERLYRIGISYLRDHGHAEDAMQNAYLKAYLNLRKFNGGSSFATWLTRIMINECLMARRRPKRETELPAEELPSSTEVMPGIAAELQAKEMKTVLEATIRDLPQNYRIVYVLREVQQLTTEETARALGLSPQNVKVTLHRARERLKTMLLQSAAAPELFAYTARWCDPMTARVMRAIGGLPVL